MKIMTEMFSINYFYPFLYEFLTSLSQFSYSLQPILDRSDTIIGSCIHGGVNCDIVHSCLTKPLVACVLGQDLVFVCLVLQVPKEHMWLQGDNTHNFMDSIHYGHVPQSLIQGNLFYRVSKFETSLESCEYCNMQQSLYICVYSSFYMMTKQYEPLSL